MSNEAHCRRDCIWVFFFIRVASVLLNDVSTFILWVIFQNEIASLSKYVLAFTIGVVSLSVFINASQTLQS